MIAATGARARRGIGRPALALAATLGALSGAGVAASGTAASRPSATESTSVAAATVPRSVMPGPAADAPDGARRLTLEAARTRWGDAQSRYADLDGISLHYKDEGPRDAPAVVLVHGSFGDLGDWDPWVAALSDRWRVVRFDRPGAGLSGAVPNGNYSLDRQLALVDALLDTLGVERAAFVGASLGGPLAFRYASTRTARVGALVLINSAGIEFGGRQGTTRAPPVSAYGWSVAPAISRAEVRRTFATILNDPAKLTDAFLERKFQLHAIAGREREAVRTIELYERGDPARILAGVRAPSLILWGAANRALSTQTAEAFAQALTRAAAVEKVVQDGGGHMLHVERPEATVTAAADFLARHARNPGMPPAADANRAHWSRVAGAWVGEAGYLDGELVPKVPRYGALLRVDYAGGVVSQTEWKVYPASPLARQYAQQLGGAELGAGEGLVLASALRGEPAGDALAFDAEGASFVAQDADSALGTVAGPAGAVRYRMLYTLPAPDRMVRTTLGFGADGALVGVSVFRFRRVDPGVLEAERRRLEKEFGAAAEVDRTDGTPRFRRLVPVSSRR